VVFQTRSRGAFTTRLTTKSWSMSIVVMQTTLSC
jgi:hypothetical protein